MNISKIAKMAGVSSATVSRYLNDGYVSEEKKERIKAVIEETGYIPSTQAQMLRTKKTKLIGVILPKISSETISKIVDGITEYLSAEGYHVLLGNTDNSTEKELEYLNIFKNNQVDGIIFIATILSEEHRSILRELTIPVIIVGQQSEDYCCVYHDDYKAAYELTKVMQQGNRSNLAFIGVTDKDKAAGLSRKQGFLKAIQEEQDSIEVIPVLQGEFSMESGYELMKQLLSGNNKIDGVFCATDNIAVGAIEAAKEMGKCVPEDIAVAGIGDTRMSKVITPSLTTVKYYYKQSGIEAAAMLMSVLKGERSCHKKIELGYEIIQRQSTK